MRYLNVQNLETAAWIARLGSFTAAADRLHTTQPAISTRVRELESALGIKLFSRAARGVALTLEGREFLAKVEPLLLHLQELSASVKSGKAIGGIVRLGAGNICMDWFPAMLKDLRDVFPELKYDVELGIGSRLLQRLEGRKLDLAIVSGPVDRVKFESQSLGFDRMVWVAAPQLLAECEARGLSFALHAPLWCVQRESFYWEDAQLAVAQGHGAVSLNAIDNMAAAAQIALQGAGAALLSETLVKGELATGRLVHIPGIAPGAPVEFSIAWIKGERHPVFQAIVEAAVRASTFKDKVPAAAASAA